MRNVLHTFVALMTLLLVVACTPDMAAEPPVTAADETMSTVQRLDQALPDLKPAALADGDRLRVVATTSIIADLVAQVGGDAIELTALMPIGVDPHGFEPTPQDLIALNEAHLVIINGLGLEAAIVPMLDSLDGDGVVVSVNAGVALRDLSATHDDEVHDEGDHDEGDHEDEVHEGEGADETHANEVHDDEAHAAEEHEHGEHEHGDVDPHTWFSVAAVKHWMENIETVLSALDPANADLYQANDAAYRAQLDALDAELAALMSQLPVDRRRLVTDHDSLGYLADAYDFQVVGTVVPSLSTMAAPSAAQLARLQDQIQAEDVKAIFVGTTINPDTAAQLAADTGIQVVSIYTGALSEPDGPAGNYLDFMRYNAQAIVDALR